MKLNSIAFLMLAVVSLVPAQDNQRQMQSPGEPAIISRDYIQDELKLSDDQKREIQKKLSDYLTGPDAPARLWEFLRVTLTGEQFKRFQQLELQHEGPPALCRPEIVRELKLTDEQRTQFIGLVQDLQKTIEPMIKAARSGGNPAETRLKIIKLRQDCQAKMETLMSRDQKKQWDEMLGRPFDTLGHH